VSASQLKRECAECGVTVRPGDGGIRAYGKLYCSEECADEGEDYTDYEYAAYDEELA
jgi:endogenous inhibitor of DNA gyrase (YacG/DUF329 family)